MKKPMHIIGIMFLLAPSNKPLPLPARGLRPPVFGGGALQVPPLGEAPLGGGAAGGNETRVRSPSFPRREGGSGG